MNGIEAMGYAVAALALIAGGRLIWGAWLDYQSERRIREASQDAQVRWRQYQATIKRVLDACQSQAKTRAEEHDE